MSSAAQTPSIHDNHDTLSLVGDVVAKAIKQGATAADAVFVSATELSVNHRMGKPEDVERAESLGIGLRVFVGDKLASVSSESLDPNSLDTMIERAIAMAKVATDDPYAGLAPEALLASEACELELCDPTEPSIDMLQAVCATAEEAALAHEGITNSEGADASYSKHGIALVTSSGFAKEYAVTDSSLAVCVLAGEGTGMERDYEYSCARHYADMASPESIGNAAAEYTLRRLNPKKVATQQVPMVFHPRVSKSFVGKLASAINGAAIARGTSFLKEQMDQAIFNEQISIVDDPHIVRGLASKPFDGEGVLNQKMTLVDQGRLTSWMLDVRSANQLGLTTTGHASRGLSGSPSPSSTNLYMQAGTVSPEALMSDIKDGFYVTDTFGMGINLITGDYSQGASGLWIEKGEVTYAVSEVTIAGNLKEMFMQMTPADDLVMRYGTNAPTVRIDGMMLAGAA